MKSAVLFLVFNRPETTKQVFEAIRSARPPKLYVSANGPRENCQDEARRCAEVRRIATDVDWPCKVNTLFRDYSLDCKMSVSGGINWFFNNEEEGIVLEDDVLPVPSFFRFCEELLEYYKNDERVMMISGDNFQCGVSRTEYSYYFSRYTHIWGWASWRRAWCKYDVSMRLWPDVRNKGSFLNILSNKKEHSYWKNIFEKVYQGEINTWDYQWLFACWIQSGLTILPNVNLISNIGFGSGGTHTKEKSELACLESRDIVFPLSHPSFILRDVNADKFTEKQQFSHFPFHKKIIDKINQRYAKNTI